MAEQSWDNSGLPAPSKKGMPTWAKVLLGCGIAAFLGMASCTGLLFWGAKKGMDYMRGEMASVWTEMDRASAQLGTEEGAKAFYAAHPGLAKSYPTEADFLGAAEGWRPKLAPLPQPMPDLLQLLKQGDLNFTANKHNGRQSETVSYRNAKGHNVRLEFEDKQLVDLNVN